MEPVESLRIAARWTKDARAFVPPTSSVRALNTLVRQAATLTLRQTLATKEAQMFPALREQLESEPLETGPFETSSPAFTLDVTWQNDAQIRELNAAHRSKNRPTDVLSFPFWEGETLFAGELLPLGDLVISLETARRQAEELRHSLAREVAFLTIHGTLHLLGFDHQSAAQRKTMFAWQDELLALFEARAAQGGKLLK